MGDQKITDSSHHLDERFKKVTGFPSMECNAVDTSSIRDGFAARSLVQIADDPEVLQNKEQQE